MKQLLPVDGVVGDIILTGRRNKEVDELLTQRRADVRVFRWIHQDHPVLIEQALIPLNDDTQHALVLKVDPSATIGKNISVAG